jgi:CRISPR-associated protein Csb2
MLAIEIEYLTGVARAASDGGDMVDWPPQPDRLFSALVASWAARGSDTEERAALEWLERQPSAVVQASPAEPRMVAKAFTPPNDDAATSVTILPARRRRQERRFPACVPHAPIVHIAWPSEPEPRLFQALMALARDTSYLGHSASLVRCQAKCIQGLGDASAARRSVYAGRLAELEHAFSAKRRPSPGASAPSPVTTVRAVTPESSFGADWIVFAHAAGSRPDAIAAAIVSKTLLKTVQAGYGTGEAPPWISGHAPDGAPLLTPHLAAVPLLDVGWTWSRGRLMGVALLLPRTLEAASRRARDPEATEMAPEDETAVAAENGLFGALARMNSGSADRLELTLRLPGGLVWTLAHEATPTAAALASLRPGRYLRPARRWASLTPIALDRYPKAPGDTEATIAEACKRIGLPAPEKVVAGKHSAVSGAVSAQPGRRVPPWAGWQLPPALVGRRLTHAVLEFGEPVSGPVILGAGRFMGLGLCLPISEQPAE